MGEQERCPTCGSENPKLDKHGDFWVDRSGRSQCCSDPFHTAPDPRSGEAEANCGCDLLPHDHHNSQCLVVAQARSEADDLRVEVDLTTADRDQALADKEAAEAERDHYRVMEDEAIAKLNDALMEAQRYREALEEAADDLGKAANQFQAIKESQAEGHQVEIIRNHEIVAEHEAKARSALTRSTASEEKRS